MPRFNVTARYLDNNQQYETEVVADDEAGAILAAQIECGGDNGGYDPENEYLDFSDEAINNGFCYITRVPGDFTIPFLEDELEDVITALQFTAKDYVSVAEEYEPNEEEHAQARLLTRKYGQLAERLREIANGNTDSGPSPEFYQRDDYEGSPFCANANYSVGLVCDLE